MKKRGQATLFIIIGIIIVALVVLFLFLRPQFAQPGQQTTTFTPQVSQVKDQVQDCLEIYSFIGLQRLGLQGGRIIPNNYYTLPSGFVEYGFYEGQDVLPSLTAMQTELNDFLDIMVPGCIGFDSFENLEITETASPQITTVIARDEVKFTMNYPLIIREGELETQLKDTYLVTQAISLGHIYSSVKGAIANEVQNESEIDLSYLLGTGFFPNTLPFPDDNVIVYVITEEDPETPYSFMFANKIKEQEQ